MFGIYFKSSLRALPILVLLPIVAFVVFVLINDVMSVQRGIYLFETQIVEWYAEYNGEGRMWMMAIMIVSILVNFLLLMIIPAAAGGIDPAVKQRQFYLGFFLNIALMLIFPIVIFVLYILNGTALFILFGLALFCFLLPFIIGARLVAPAYVRAFWFKH